MSLYKILKEDLVTEIKSRSGNSVKKDLLRYVIGQVDQVADAKTELTDELVTKILISTKKGCDEVGNTDESDIIAGYLPKQLSVDQLQDAIDKIISDNGFEGMAKMGLVMKEVKAKFGAAVDGKLASAMVKATLSV